MTSNRSRYAQTRPFTRETPDGFAGMRPRPISTPGGVVSHSPAPGERMDLLALEFYDTDQHWWRIMDANPGLDHAGEALAKTPAGQLLQIPRAEG